jgi:hypothetical protein
MKWKRGADGGYHSPGWYIYKGSRHWVLDEMEGQQWRTRSRHKTLRDAKAKAEWLSQGTARCDCCDGFYYYDNDTARKVCDECQIATAESQLEDR